MSSEQPNPFEKKSDTPRRSPEGEGAGYEVPKSKTTDRDPLDLARAEHILQSVEVPSGHVASGAKLDTASKQLSSEKKGFSEQLKNVYTRFARTWRHVGSKRLPYMETYVEQLIPESEHMKALRAETEKFRRDRRMRSEASEATFLKFLIEFSKAREVLELGTFTGYGTLAIAEALPPDGKVLTCDLSAEAPSIGKKYWQASGVESKISLTIGKAAEIMRSLINEGRTNSFDLIFIDANKDEYGEYYELALTLAREGGIVAIDNTLWGGLVANKWVNDRDTLAIKALNEKISQDKRVIQTIIPGWDGLTLAIKRQERPSDTG